MAETKDLETKGNETVVWEFFATPTMQVVIGLLILCVLIALGFYLVSNYRDSAARDRPEEFDREAFLREIHREGDISDSEYRTIQSAMDGKITRESKADGKEG